MESKKSHTSKNARKPFKSPVIPNLLQRLAPRETLWVSYCKKRRYPPTVIMLDEHRIDFTLVYKKLPRYNSKECPKWFRDLGEGSDPETHVKCAIAYVKEDATEAEARAFFNKYCPGSENWLNIKCEKDAAVTT